MTNDFTPAQQEVLDVLKSAYDRYSKLVSRVMEVIDKDHASVYDVKRDILNALSESLKDK